MRPTSLLALVYAQKPSKDLLSFDQPSPSTRSVLTAHGDVRCKCHDKCTELFLAAASLLMPRICRQAGSLARRRTDRLISGLVPNRDYDRTSSPRCRRGAGAGHSILGRLAEKPRICSTRRWQQDRGEARQTATGWPCDPPPLLLPLLLGRFLILGETICGCSRIPKARHPIVEFSHQPREMCPVRPSSVRLALSPSALHLHRRRAQALLLSLRRSPRPKIGAFLIGCCSVFGAHRSTPRRAKRSRFPSSTPWTSMAESCAPEFSLHTCTC